MRSLTELADQKFAKINELDKKTNSLKAEKDVQNQKLFEAERNLEAQEQEMIKQTKEFVSEMNEVTNARVELRQKYRELLNFHTLH